MIEQMDGCVWVNNCDSPQAAAAIGTGPGVMAEEKHDPQGCIFSFFLKCPGPNEVALFLSTESRNTGVVEEKEEADVVPERRPGSI
jgi:hypothetical protein